MTTELGDRLTLARPPLANHLDIIKFICKDLFLYVFSKQIDNLRTNHRVRRARSRFTSQFRKIVLLTSSRVYSSFNHTLFHPSYRYHPIEV